MIFGLKLWSTNVHLVDEAIELIENRVFDYIELFVVPGSSIEPFEIDIPFTIHAAHEKFGTNIADDDATKYTLPNIMEAIEWANFLNADNVIIHSGHGNIENAIEFLEDNADERLLIENVPKHGLSDEKMIGYTPSQIEIITKAGNCGFCLDFGHAIKAAISQKRNYRDYISEFLKLEPKMFHISDGNLETELDEHLSIN